MNRCIKLHFSRSIPHCIVFGNLNSGHIRNVVSSGISICVMMYNVQNEEKRWKMKIKTKPIKIKYFRRLKISWMQGQNRRRMRENIEKFHNNNKHGTNGMRGAKVRCRVAIQHLVASLLQFYIENSRLVAYILEEKYIENCYMSMDIFKLNAGVR